MKDLTLNFTEFTTFLLLHASYADLEFTDDERSRIISRVSEETFQKVSDIYDTLGEYERLKLIMDHKGTHYPTPAQKMEILDIMRSQFEADGEFSRLEKGLLLFLEKLL